MKKFMEDRGYKVVSFSQIAKDFGFTGKNLISDLNLFPNTFDYKVAFKPEEKEIVYKLFIDTINKRNNCEIKDDHTGGKWFWYDDRCYGEMINEYYTNLFLYILDIRTMKVIRDEFEKHILRHG